MKTLLLRIVLVVVGGLMCLSGAMLVLPASQLETMVGWFVGAQTASELWPDGPVFDYLMRTCMVAYLWIGVILLLAAANPAKHRAQIHVAMGAFLLLAVVCLVAGIANGLPVGWYLGDALPSLLTAILLFVLRPGKAPA